MEAAGAPGSAAAAVDPAAALSPEPAGDVKPTTELLARPPTALTPPTSEEMNHAMKTESDDSELSDLDLDEDEHEHEREHENMNANASKNEDEDEEDDDDDDEVEVVPDHYWEGGKVPIFKPTMDQFRDFQKYIHKIDKYGMKSGIVKIIPPSEWRESLPALDEYVKRIKIKNPITQEFNGAYGTYTQQNVEKQRSYNLPEWKALTEETQHQPPAKRGERRRQHEKLGGRHGGSLRSRASTAAAAEADASPKPRRKAGRPRRNPLPTEEAESGDDAAGAKRARGGARSKGGGRAGQAKSVASRRLNNTVEAEEHVDERAFDGFDYRMDGVDEFTTERCAELETLYWKSLAFNQPMYAADMPGSLFDDTTTSWNVAKLPNLLDVLGTKVPGVNTAYLYMGMWKATFAWHLEDVDLYSINYIHFGAPKQWYSISQEDARKFEAAMRQVWPLDAKNCDQFLRHKTYLISPDVLQKQFGVKVNKLVHYEGEFVITYPYGYHSGYNIGYNCAESVNFATESWLDYGRIARKCNCEADNVWVDVAEIERKLRGEPTPEYYEETDDDDDDDGLSGEEDGNLPSPPASVKGKAPRGRKRKRDVAEAKPPKKKKKIRIKVKAPTREPCVLCPNDNPWEDLLPTDHGKKAHRSCAQYTPETWIDKDAAGHETICGVPSVDRARLDLKCNFCRSKRGACFQCSSKKCTRAFHATCALAAGVLVDAGLVPTFGEDGTEYFEEGYDFRCKYHRPKPPKHLNVESLENSKRIHNYAKELQFNHVVQAQYLGGEVFAGLVVENRPAELSVVVDVLPEGDRIEVEWKWLCVLDPDDSQRPKPSANALPMPEGMNKKAVSTSNRQDGVPEQGDPFADNPDYKFHEFYNMHMPPQGYASKQLEVPMKLKVDVHAPDQLYYYLPAASTEAKCFYTDKAGSTEIAPKANFAERVSARQGPNVKPPALAAARPPAKAAAKPSASPAVPQHLLGTIASSANRGEKPYVYKPREPATPNALWGIDPQALATQKIFVARADRRSSQHNVPPEPESKPPYQHHGRDFSRNGTPLRPFPRDHYYSTEMLPAAIPGEYSDFTQIVRRQSQGAQSLPRPGSQSGGYVPNCQPVSHEKRESKNGATTPNAHYSSGRRPPSSALSSHSPSLALAATTSSSASKLPAMPPGYLENLQKYPYLRNSFLRSKRPYESPYSTHQGGFSSSYLPLELDKPAEHSTDKGPTPLHTPSASVSSVGDHGRQWTPPSQVWHSSGFGKLQTPPPSMSTQHQQARPPSACRYPAPTFATPGERRQSLQSMPSTASREGAQARLLREQMGGYSPLAPHGYAPHARNSFGHASDTAKMWQSPKAPTASPLSDTNVSGSGIHHYTHTHNTPMSSGGGGTWDILPPSQAPPAALPMMKHRLSDGGYGPMLPQMHGGDESWRLN